MTLHRLVFETQNGRQQAERIAALIARKTGFQMSVEDVTPCKAVVHHGPGHQSTTTCSITGPHTLHEADIMGQLVEWTDDDADPDGEVYTS